MWTLLALLATSAPQAAPGAALIDRNRADRAPATTRPLARQSRRRSSVSVAVEAPATTIRGIAFLAAQAPAPVAAAARPFIGKPATRATLDELAQALSDGYADSDIALYTVAIPQQDFANGVVQVQLIEGRVAKVAIADAQAHPLLAGYLDRLTTERPLSRATYERQLSLMRAIPGMTVDPEFTDPEATGALVLTAAPRQRRHRVTAGFTNRGVDLLGEGQFDLRGDLYGLATDGDLLSLSASASGDLKGYRYAAGSYQTPIGGSGLTASGGAAYLETRLRGTAISGRAKQANVALAYPVVRRFHQSTDISFGLDGLNSDNAVFGNLVATERTRAARLAGSLTDARERRSVSISGSVSRGLDVLGARVTRPLAEPDFLKATVAASIDQAIGQRVIGRLSASAQLTDDRLPAAERFAIGGEAIGRAFDTAVLTGDRGYGGLAEIAVRPLKAARLANSEVYAFVDGGRVTVLDRIATPTQHYSLASAGAGVRARWRDKVELGLEGARVIDDPYPGYGEDWRLSVSWRLQI